MAAFLCEGCGKRVPPFGLIYPTGDKTVGACCFNPKEVVLKFFKSKNWNAYTPGASGFTCRPFDIHCYKFWDQEMDRKATVIQLDDSFDKEIWNGEWKVAKPTTRGIFTNAWNIVGKGWPELIEYVNSKKEIE